MADTNTGAPAGGPPRTYGGGGDGAPRPYGGGDGAPRPYGGGDGAPRPYGGGDRPSYGGGGDRPGYQGRPSGPGGPGGRPRPRGKDRYVPRRKVCAFCQEKLPYVDYKDVNRLRRFLSERGKIEPRRKTGTCARHQRALTVALKRARHVALLPFVGQAPR